MKKQVFQFHFKVGFLSVIPNFGNWWRMLPDFLWWLPVAVFITLDQQHARLVDYSVADISTTLWYWVLCGAIAPLAAALFWGSLYGAWKVHQFRDYHLIKRAPGYRAFVLSRTCREFKKHCAAGIPKEKERIIASANLHSDGSVWAVMSPGRHHHCHWFAADYGRTHRTVEQQGFLTNKYRFLGREDALKLAKKNGQCINPAHQSQLFSEDLWGTPKHLRQPG